MFGMAEVFDRFLVNAVSRTDLVNCWSSIQCRHHGTFLADISRQRVKPKTPFCSPNLARAPSTNTRELPEWSRADPFTGGLRKVLDARVWAVEAS